LIFSEFFSPSNSLKNLRNINQTPNFPDIESAPKTRRIIEAASIISHFILSPHTVTTAIMMCESLRRRFFIGIVSVTDQLPSHSVDGAKKHSHRDVFLYLFIDLQQIVKSVSR
jgi:hypothetical protein